MPPDSRYEVNEAVVSTDLGDEAVLLDLETQHYFTVNETGLAIWSMLSEARSLAEIGEGLAQLYEIDLSEAMAVATRFIDRLVEDGLVVPRNEASPDTHDPD